MDQDAIDGFVEAGELWSAIYSDEITVNIDIAFEQLSPGVLGSTGSERTTVTYQEFVNAVAADETSGDDTIAGANLQAPPDFDMLMNRTRDSPHGAGDADPYLDDNGDANNTTIRVTRANAKALGLLPPEAPGLDASISFSSDFNWDFDPSDGVQANHFNFVFVAAHEIGHMLGFTSGVDILDGNSPPRRGPFDEHQFTFVSPADVYRFSSDSVDEGAGIIDWSADNRAKFFSIDGGASDLGEFSRGRTFGDGQQASHWKDDRGLGIMDPTAAPGEVSTITTLDTQLFDVIGWDLETVADPVEADLAISTAASVSVTYTITASNQGPDDVTGAVLTNDFPSSLVNVTWTCVPSGGASCSASGSGDIQDVVDLPDGASVTYTATGSAAEFAGNTATIAAPAGVTDTDSSNNSSDGGGG
jgi:uncharacterized repeat protein (TIGR01451 family)